MKIIKKYFPDLSTEQENQLSNLELIYKRWNSKINVISRKSIKDINTHHILHSLSIVKIIKFRKDSKIMDLGTGGGFPGIPLAIMNPQANFILIDSTRKKIKVVKEVCDLIKIKNIEAHHMRAEHIDEKFDFIISRGVTQMNKFIKLTQNKFNHEHKNNLENGIIYLKGGDLKIELNNIQHTSYDIADFFKEDFFLSKKIIHISKNEL